MIVGLSTSKFIGAILMGIILSFGIIFLGSPIGIDLNNPWVVLIIVLPLSYGLFKFGYQIGHKL